MIDFEYICIKMGDMSGLPIRIYKEKKLIFQYCVIPLIKDPIIPFLDEVLNRKKHVDYYLTKDFDTYGIINGKDFSIVMGPSISVNATLQHLKKKAFDLNIPVDQNEEYVNQLNSLVRMPLNSILQISCTINYIVNDEKLNLEDLSIEDRFQAPRHFENSEQDSYRSYLIENKLCEFIKNGDLPGFETWAKNAPTVRAGKVANDTLRQQKNIFIVSATLFSRKAIEAGIDIKESLLLSDYYIQQCELIDSIDKIVSLQFSMILAYIKKVAEMKELNSNNYLAKKIYSYITNNISMSISTSDIAKYMHLSRSYLSTMFKKETGYDLKTYIHKIKINHAKQLLIESDNSLLSISTYLGYSSSSHFTKAFKAEVKMSPSKYRNQYKK